MSSSPAASSSRDLPPIATLQAAAIARLVEGGPIHIANDDAMHPTVVIPGVSESIQPPARASPTLLGLPPPPSQSPKLSSHSARAPSPSALATERHFQSLAVTGVVQSSDLMLATSTGAMLARQQQSDHSTLMLERWLEDYQQERKQFASVQLFCEVKLKELIELTSSLSSSPSSPAPSQVRTAVCIDLFDLLIASIEHGATSTAHTEHHSKEHESARIVLAQLLAKLRDQLVSSIYAEPLPPHLLLAFQERPVDKKSRHRMLEEKVGASKTRGGTSFATHISPPCLISAFLEQPAWFSLIPGMVSRNQQLAESARIIMIPSKLFRLRQIQKKVVAGMTAKWRALLVKWKFWEWRSITQASKERRLYRRNYWVVHSVTKRQRLLYQQLVFYAWRQVCVARRYIAMKTKRALSEQQNNDLIHEAQQLATDTKNIQAEINKLEKENESLSEQYRILKLRYEQAHADLQDNSKHQQACSDLLEALRLPLKAVFSAVQQQIDSFCARDLYTIHPLINTIVDEEYQAQLNQLGEAPILGLEGWALNITQGTQKWRIAICSQIVVRWLTLQLRRVYQYQQSPSLYPLSEYLQNPDNQQRLSAALARIRTFCSTVLPASLPSFPRLLPTVTKPKKKPNLLRPNSMGGSQQRSRERSIFNTANSPNSPSTPTTPNEEKSDDRRGKFSRQSSREQKEKEKDKEKEDKLRRIDQNPLGTLSTPIRVFSQLRDSDRAEVIFATTAVLMHSDAEIGKTLRLANDKRFNEEEKHKMAKLKEVMENLKVHADMDVAEMDHAAQTIKEGIASTYGALQKARSHQARLQAVEDEVFAQSVKMLHQQAQKRQRGIEKDATPTDLLKLDIHALNDLIEPHLVNRSDREETDNVLQEYCKDLYKVFVFYCHRPDAVTIASEPTMNLLEFWRFIRDCKLKLPNDVLENTYTKMAKKAGRMNEKEIKEKELEKEKEKQSVDGDASGENELKSSHTSSSHDLEAHLIDQSILNDKPQASRDINFKLFGELLLRLGLLKYPNERLLNRKLRSLIIGHILSHCFIKALNFHKQQMMIMNGSTAIVSLNGLQATNGAMLNLSTPEVEAVYKRYSSLIKQIFNVYAKITPTIMTMAFNDVLGFTRDYELLHRSITQHDLKFIYTNIIKEMPNEEAQRLVELQRNRESDSSTLNTPARQKKYDDDDALYESTLAASKEMAYPQFLELLSALSHFSIRNPYYALHDRVEKFIVTVIASKKKLPQKTFRSAV